jgi:hypothetical protein
VSNIEDICLVSVPVITTLCEISPNNTRLNDKLLWDCGDHPDKGGGKGSFAQGQLNTKTYWKQSFEDINYSSEHDRNMVHQLRGDMLLSLKSMFNTTLPLTSTSTAAAREIPPRSSVAQRIEIFKITCTQIHIHEAAHI